MISMAFSMPASTLIFCHSSYHLDRLLPMDRVAKGMIPTAPVAAVTGALQWIGRDAFQRNPQPGLPSKR